MSEKLQKVLARAGLGSRRKMEDAISRGRVMVNGKPATLGDRVTASDKILFDGTPVKNTKIETGTRQVLLYNKPVGEICSRQDRESRPLVYDNIPPPSSGSWISIGRLDVNTAGLLLFTNDGELANQLMHPSSQVVREYAVRVFGEIDGLILDRLTGGVMLDDGPARFESIKEAGGSGMNRWYHVVLKEGRKREVRRLWESQGMKVSRLIRIRFGPFRLDRDMKPGAWFYLTEGQIRQLTPMLRKPDA
jgi:23S rRNA pseudouridine2605 synthase